MKTSKVNSFLYFFIFFLTFAGFYAILIMALNTGYGGATRIITQPIRLLIVFLILTLLFVNIKQTRIRQVQIYYILFSLLIFIRLFIDYYKGMGAYYLSGQEVILYFVSFSIIPFIVISILEVNSAHLNAIFNSFLISGAVFAIVSVTSYGRFIGEVTRIASSRVGEDVLNPLALSYTSSLLIGIFVFYMMHNHVTRIRKICLYLIIGFLTIPFFLGASRGSLFSLFLPFLINFRYITNSKNLFKNIFVLSVSLVLLFYLDDYFQSGLLNRFTGGVSNYATGTKEARNFIWAASFNQFITHPLFGDSFINTIYDRYPHNFLLETLQSIGLIGFVPLSVLIFKGWKISLQLFKTHRKLTWVSVVFIQAFMQGMFSGSILSNAWLWTSLALLFSIEKSLLQINS